MLDDIYGLLGRWNNSDPTLESTIETAERAISCLEGVINKLEVLQDRDLEKGDVVQTCDGRGIVRGIRANGSIAVDIVEGEHEEYSSLTFAPDEVRKVTPQDQFRERIDEVMQSQVEDGRVDQDEAITILEEMMETMRGE